MASADVRQIVSGARISLERTATQQFGQAAEDFVRQGINSILGTQIGINPQNPSVAGRNRIWDSTDYAGDFFGRSEAYPKQRFLFKVQFMFSPAYLNLLDATQQNRAFTYMIKTVDRPKVEYEYEEVNMYNFRTKILKTIKHKELSMEFMDDSGNNVADFFNAYRIAYSPIGRKPHETNAPLEEQGMNFANPLPLSPTPDSAVRGVLAKDDNGIATKNVLDRIIVRQIFVDMSAKSVKEVDFIFINPRILSFDLDAVNHESGETSNVTVQFDYDALYVSPAFDIVTTPEPVLPGRDILSKTQIQPVVFPRAPGVKPVGRNPFLDIIVNTGSRILGSTASNATRRLLGNVPGGGVLASSVGGMIGEAARQSARTISNAPNQAFARPSNPPLNDSAVAVLPPNSVKISSSSPNGAIVGFP